MLRKPLLLALLIAPLTSLAACTDDDEPAMRSGGRPDSGTTYTCSASIRPTMFDYAASASVLTMFAPDGTAMTVPRVGSGGPGALGTWLISEQGNGVLNVRGTLTLTANRATVTSECSGGGKRATAAATSSAEITDDTITFFETDSKEVRF
jgi:hypothetical protein